MKSLYFVRHAKSSWKDPNLTDSERPLNKRGLRDAPFMAKLLADKGVKIDLVLSSPAIRALTTAQHMAEGIGYAQDKIRIEPRLYGESFNMYLNVIKELEAKYSSVMIVAHNPTMTTIINYLTDYGLENLPTCGVFGIELQLESWAKVSQGVGQCRFYEYPKKYFED
ncbi:MAG: histidine phosphatase family protein [Chlorobiales bacterium]|nr:histidine phosphatase family protein [Chlorobiales bacterium]